MSMPAKVPVNLENYPALQAYAEKDKAAFIGIMKSMFALVNQAVADNWHNISEDYFGMSLQELTSQLLHAMFDHKGIMDHHPNESNGQALSEMYEYALNPLTAAFTKEGLLDHEGNAVSFMEKFGLSESEFTVKKWVQGLLFYSYYCSLPDLAKALATNDYTLIDEEKHVNIAKLIEIRPVLDYQKRIGILPGKLIPGTGFFDAGQIKNLNQCPACQVPEEVYDLGEIAVCTNCKAGFEK